MDKRMELNFIKTDGKSARITVPNANEELQPEDVESVMNAVIAANVFAPGGADLLAADSARVVTTSTVDYDFAG